MKKAVKIIPLVFIFHLLVFWGCDKQEHTLPVDFNLQFEIDKKPVMEGRLTIESIVISLGSIDIDGRREVGENVFMTRKFENGETIDVSGTLPENKLSFNLPQGIYDPLTFLLNFKPDPEEEDLDDDIEDWLEDLEEGDEDIEDLQEDLGEIIEDYLDEVQPCILVKARYQRSNIFYHVIFAVNDPLLFRVMARNSEGGITVSLSKDRINEGVIVLDPSYWFSVISPSMLESAFIGIIDDDDDDDDDDNDGDDDDNGYAKYIFLHKKVNSQLFTTILNRLEESTILYIKE